MMRRVIAYLMLFGALASCVCAQPRDVGRFVDTNSITTVPPPPPPPPPMVPKPQPRPALRASVMVQSVPIMELIGVHAEVRIEDPFPDAALRGIGISAGAGYSIFTPSFVPVMLTTIWGRRHHLEVALGSSIPINYVYGTNPTKPLTWPEGYFNFTTLVGYRFQSAESGVMYRVFVKGLLVPGLNSGLLPCLGGSLGFTL